MRNSSSCKRSDKWKLWSVEKTLSSSLNLKKRDNTCQSPLITSTLLSVCCKSVTWSQAISLHNAENTWEFRGLALTKLTIFTVLSKNTFQTVRHSLGSKSLSVNAAVYPSGVGSNCLYTRYHSTMSPCHGFSIISTDTNTSLPTKYIWCHKAVQYYKNILSCCPGLQWFAEEDVFLNWPPINVTDIYQAVSYYTSDAADE